MPNLVGIGLSQVPTNSMLGGLAYQDPEHASIKDLDLKNLSQINSEIADTAVDIFLYDTSKDSDGGAWRKRTTNTSWYNETLGTATRGNRREFPSVAVIVAEATKLTIYDGDDPNLPMWMVFNLSGSVGSACNMLTRGGGGQESDITSIACLNAKLVVGLKDVDGTVGEGPVEINFISDFGRVYRETGSGYTGAIYNLPISGRNSNSAYNGDYNSLGIVAQTVNDVAMTVLPNSQVDEITGLPIPTIAVATASGVSVIKDDGSVVDITANAGSNYHNADFITISSDGFLVFPQHGSGSSGEYSLMSIPIPDSDRTTQTSSGNANDKYIFNDPNSALVSLPHGLGVTQNGALKISGTQFLNYPNGLLILDENPSSLGDAMVNYITKDYNTGWMQGDIKSAFLSDTDTTNVTGEKIDLTNGSVPTGNNASVASITANQLVFQSSSEAVGRYDTGTTLVTGKQYHATLTISNYSGSGDLGVASGGGIDSTFRYSANGTYTRYITGNDANEIQLFYRNTNSATIGLTIKETDLDRSHYNKGLEVRGTISKQVVATDADLVSYGPFNNNNNLRQPYNADLNFNQTDFSIVFWVYDTGVDQHCTLISRDQREFDISRLSNAYGNKLRIYTRNSSEILRAPDSTSALPQNKWVCVCVVYTGGNTKKVYLDGVLDRTITSTEGEYDIDSTSYGMTIGARNTNGVYNYSSAGVELALMRISGSAPSDEQVKKIYEDEKVLFQENAKATLYGSSDAVTALAYDEDTELLHVGTSSGRSDFQGLRRINNTTTAVTTAISAHDGFIVEQ